MAARVGSRGCSLWLRGTAPTNADSSHARCRDGVPRDGIRSHGYPFTAGSSNGCGRRPRRPALHPARREESSQGSNTEGVGALPQTPRPGGSSSVRRQCRVRRRRHPDCRRFHRRVKGHAELPAHPPRRPRPSPPGSPARLNSGILSLPEPRRRDDALKRHTECHRPGPLPTCCLTPLPTTHWRRTATSLLSHKVLVTLWRVPLAAR